MGILIDDERKQMTKHSCFRFFRNAVAYGTLAFVFWFLSMFIQQQTRMEDLTTIGPYYDCGFPVWFKSGATGGSIAADFIPSRMLLNYLLWFSFFLLFRYVLQKNAAWIPKRRIICFWFGLAGIAFLSVAGNILLPKSSGREIRLMLSVAEKLGIHLPEER